MKIVIKNYHYVLWILLFANCQAQNAISPKASDYITETLDLLEQKSVNRNVIDWHQFKIDVFKKAQNAKDIKDTYPAISYAVSKLNDNHSYFRPITESESNAQMQPLPVLPDERTPDDIGYIRIPFCVGTEQEHRIYIAKIREKIKAQSKKKLKGWIVDLRGNFGGNMWPMLLAVEPLIGNGMLGYFIEANNSSQAWKLAKGKAYIDEQLIIQTNFLPEKDLSKQFVAVLTDSHTASSGEAMAIAFKGRENTKSFGLATFGVSTGCVSHKLSDGSVINLAETIFADRKKTKYGSRVIPDFEVHETQALKAGIEWIYQMNE